VPSRVPDVRVDPHRPDLRTSPVTVRPGRSALALTVQTRAWSWHDR
jgi:hypothetical protein